MDSNDISIIEKINAAIMLTNQLTIQGNQNCIIVANIYTYLSQALEELKLNDKDELTDE